MRPGEIYLMIWLAGAVGFWAAGMAVEGGVMALGFCVFLLSMKPHKEPDA